MAQSIWGSADRMAHECQVSMGCQHTSPNTAWDHNAHLCQICTAYAKAAPGAQGAALPTMRGGTQT